MAIKKKVRLDTSIPSLSYLKPFEKIIGDTWKYLRMNMNGSYEIAFLPLSGGLLEQEADWVEDTEIILRCFNTKT